MAPHSSAQVKEIQENICIRSKINTRPAERRDVLQAGLEVGDYNLGHEDSSDLEDEGSGTRSSEKPEFGLGGITDSFRRRNEL